MIEKDSSFVALNQKENIELRRGVIIDGLNILSNNNSDPNYT